VPWKNVLNRNVSPAERHHLSHIIALRQIVMNDREQLSALIGDIYDAALDPAQRICVVDKIASFAGGHSGGLLSKHSLSKSENLYCYIGADPESLQVYSESYPKLDPTADVPSFGVEQIVSTSDLVPYEEFRRGRFYQEWARPHGWVDVASAVIEKSAASCTFLSVFRHQASGLVDDEMRRRMALVVPHVRRALLIGKTLNLKQAEAVCFSDILDGLSAGMILVDANSRIVHANAAGNAILDAADFLRAVCAGWLPAMRLSARSCRTSSSPRSWTRFLASKAAPCR